VVVVQSLKKIKLLFSWVKKDVCKWEVNTRVLVPSFLLKLLQGGFCLGGAGPWAGGELGNDVRAGGSGLGLASERRWW